jgi:hypothetical protein
MQNILGRMTARPSRFVPKTTREFFALYLARMLNDAANARHYVALTEKYSEAQLLRAYRKAADSSIGAKDLSERFHEEIRRLNHESY